MPEYETKTIPASDIRAGMLLADFAAKGMDLKVRSSFAASNGALMCLGIGNPTSPTVFMSKSAYVTVKVPVEPEKRNEDLQVIVLEDGETYGPLYGCSIVNIPGYVPLDQMDNWVKDAVEEKGKHFITKFA